MGKIIIVGDSSFSIRRNIINKVLTEKKNGMESLEYIKIGTITHNSNNTMNCHDNEGILKVNNGSIKDIIKVLNSL